MASAQLPTANSQKMTPFQALDLIRPGVDPTPSVWADLGAGAGMFTEALRQLLPEGTIYAVDKNPHMLWRIAGGAPVAVIVHEGDFNQPLELPRLEGLVMANALHYAPDPVHTLSLAMEYLRPEGAFILVEYETEEPRAPWIPFPLPLRRFEEVAAQAGLPAPRELHRVPAAYGHQHIYSALIRKPDH